MPKKPKVVAPWDANSCIGSSQMTGDAMPSTNAPRDMREVKVLHLWY